MRILLILACSLMFACGDRTAQPEGILDRDVFRDVLFESQLIEARMQHELVLERMHTIPGKDHYLELFKSKGVTQQEFEDTFEYYRGRPEELRSIYEEIIAELSRRKDEVPEGSVAP